MIHIVSATTLTGGEQLAMCGHVFPSYGEATRAGHAVGNYTPRLSSRSAYRRMYGVECEACMVRHSDGRVS